MPLELMVVWIGCLAVAIGAIAGSVAGRYTERRKWEARAVESPGPLGTASVEQAARMERLEQTVDAIAVELERVGEGQRFLTKLLADNRAVAATRSPAPGTVRSPRPPA